MPWTGPAGSQTFQRSDGTRSGTQVWQQADAAGIDIVAPDHDLHDQDIGDGLSSCLKKDGGNTATSNLPMGGFRLQNVGGAVAINDSASAADVINNRLSYCTVGGTANAIVLTHAVPITSYSAGQQFSFFATLSNTGAVTVAVDGLAAKAINVVGTALSVGQILAGAWVTIAYNAVTSAFELAVGTTPAAISVGSVMAWPKATIPAGWLEADGSSVSRATYSALFTIYGTDYGVGDGSTTFNLPNYKDQFLRGFDASGTDASSRTDRGDGTTGASVGTKQAYDTKAHTHPFIGTAVSDHTHNLQYDGQSRSAGGGGGDSVVTTDSTNDSRATTAAGGHTPAGTNSTYPATGGAETRPKNITVKWIILALPSASISTAQVAPYITTVTTDRTGNNDANAQPVFASTEDTFTLPGSTSYHFEALYSITRAAGTTSHTTSVLFGGTATFTSILYTITSTTTTGAPTAATNCQMLKAKVATATVAATTSTSGTENIVIELKGIIRINASGTVIPQFQYSAIPGGVPTIEANSYFKLTPFGADTTASVGPTS